MTLKEIRDWGLSPRMRGNPDDLPRNLEALVVYPRACGGTITARSTTTV